MNQLLQTTFRLMRTLGVAATAVALLLTSSGHHLAEEIAQEVVAEEAKLGLARHEVRSLDSNGNRSDAKPNNRKPYRSSLSHPCFYRVKSSERDQFNGLGTHLLI